MSQAENYLRSSIIELKNLMDTKTVIGNPIKVDDKKIILPLSEVKLCFVSGGSEISSKGDKFPFGGLSGGNIIMRPNGFLVLEEDKISTISVEKDDISNLFINVMKLLSKKK